MSSKLIFQDLPNAEQIQKRTQPTVFQEFIEYLFYFLRVFVVVAVVYIFVRTSIFEIIVVKGTSMSPSYENTDVIYIDLLTPKFSEYKRGEVVVIRAPINNIEEAVAGKGTLFIKRVIAVPGDTIILDEGKVFIYNMELPNGAQLDESSYLASTVKTCKDIRACEEKYEKQVLGTDEYYVMGDNRPNSTDSRVIGKIKKSEIVGREFYRILPADKIGPFNIPKYNITN